MKLISILTVSLLLFNTPQPDITTDELIKVMKTQDSLLFDVGFNTCDISQFEKLVSDSGFTFYHDQSGMMSSKQEFISSIKDGLCQLDYKPRRELVEGSMELYPLKKDGVIYAAMQMGIHKFYAIEKGKPEYLTSTAKFMHLWKLEGGEWKLAQVMSFEHKRPK